MKPTILSPWFVVQKFSPCAHCKAANFGMIEYYMMPEDRPGLFTPDKKRAAIFMSIHSAARVAQSEAAEVRALTTEEEVTEFGR